MKRYGLFFAVAILLALGAAACAAPSGEPIKIGYLATLTGDGSTWVSMSGTAPFSQ
jgi:hypothetical protein